MKAIIILIVLNFCVFVGFEGKERNSSFILEKLSNTEDSLNLFGEEDIFALLTADSVLNTEGVHVILHENQKSASLLEDCIVYEYLSASKAIAIRFGNYHLKGEGLEKERMHPYFRDYYISMLKPGEKMRILQLPQSFLEGKKTVDLDEEFSCLEHEDVDAFVKKFERKRIWIIDRNTMTDSTITLVETILLPFLVDEFGKTRP